MINALLWAPLAFGFVGLFLPKRVVGWWATAGAVATLVIGVIMAFGFENGAPGMQDTVNTNLARKTTAESVLKSATADDSTKDKARSDLQEVAEAEKANAQATRQVVASLGNERFLRGFGNNGGEEFLSYMNLSETLLAQGGESWEKWDRQVCETVTTLPGSAPPSR